MKDIEFKVTGMTCNHCAQTIKNELTEHGYVVAEIDSESGKLLLNCAEDSAAEAVLTALKPLFAELEYGIDLA